MNFFRLICSSFRFHARSHLGPLLGAAIGSAVLIGALIVGDSVRASLRGMALARIGKADVALVGNDRFFRAQLASELNGLGDTAALLQVPGIVATSDNSARANQVQILGVDDGFWKLAQSRLDGALADGVILNDRLAHHLKATVGDSVLLRVHKPSLLSRDSPISPQEDTSVVMRLSVSAIADDNAFGHFSLQANQIPPLNAFVPISLLQKRLELPGKANLLLAKISEGLDPGAALRNNWQLADAQLALVKMTNQPGSELRSERVFLDEPIANAALKATPRTTGVLTYFVNELRLGDRSTPYSIVTAADAPIVPKEMRDNEILLNEWLAEDLGAKAGDEISLSYFVPGSAQQLVERTNVFTVRAIVPMEGIYADRTLMPEFPGIAKAEKTENWDAGFTIEMKKLRPKDEAYWEQFRGTPKAFITLPAGQGLWANRFGDLTAVRYPESAAFAELETALQKSITPQSVGLSFLPLREGALAASAPAQDFGQLFLGFSFFLILAALILMALLFQFGVEQRIRETGTLLALGFRPKQVRNLLLLEGSGIALLGGILGVIGGIFYARAMLAGLTTIWRSATGTSALTFHFTPVTLAIGLSASFIVSVLTIFFVLRKQGRQPARELLSSDPTSSELSVGEKNRNWAEWVFALSVIVALGLVAFALWQQQTANAGIFFGAGALLLVAGLSGVAAFLKRIARSSHASDFNLSALGIRNTTRRRKRSLATMALLASGTFLIVAVGAFRLETSDQLTERSSGTGGFALLGESAFPVIKNLNETAGREFFGLEEADLPDVSFVSFRVRAGDDASCLNLNSAQTPRLLGVDPDELARRGAFSFAKTVEGATVENPWLLLKATSPDEIPAIGDDASITWAMRKKVGDTLDYTDERGNRFKVRIVASVANSILQGNLLIDERAFIEKFPGEAGYRMFLIDAPSNNVSEVSQALSRALRDAGLEITPAAERLAAFNAVQNTYLNTFQILGGLGLLLGSAGLGIVVLRNVFERRGEFATLQAIGFRKRALRWLVLNEHAVLLWFGLIIGVVAAGIAILPNLLYARTELPLVSLGILLGAILFCGLLSTIVATSLALRGELLNALRNE
ncbi:MAG: ABC transporter permease [Verrucomicrobia bacterium]|nr:ABC transporter permease [Verrucomicrobiota bacterium]